MDTVHLIDLEAPAPVREEPAPWRHAWRTYQRSRRVVAPVVLLALLLGTAHAATPVRPRLLPVVTLPQVLPDAFTTIGDTLYSLRPDGGRARLEAHRLTDGRLVWSTPTELPDNPRAASLRVFGLAGVVTVMAQSHTRDSLVPGPPEVHAYDPATGRELWRRVGELGVELPGGILTLRVSQSVWQPGSDEPEHHVEVSFVEAGTGRLIRSEDRGERSAYLPELATAAGRVTADLTPENVLRAYDQVTGEVLTTSLIDASPGATLVLVGDWLILFDGPKDDGSVEGRHPSMRLYELPSLNERWRRPMLSDRSVVVCGPWLCAVGDRHIEAIEPASGAPRWSVEGWRTLMPLGDRAPSDLLLVGYTAAGPEYAIADARTGEIRFQFTNLNPEWIARDRGFLLVSQGRSAVLGHTGLLGIVGPGASNVLWLGPVTGEYQCRTAGPYLFCFQAKDLVAWRIST